MTSINSHYNIDSINSAIITRTNVIVIMTRSLIRLGNTVRTSLNTGLNDKVHDETRVKADVKTNVDDDGITKGYNE